MVRITSVSSLPLVSMPTLCSLQDSLDGDASVCQRFVDRYVAMSQPRFSRLRLAVETCSWDDAMDAALSLYSASIMVGALRLGNLAQGLIQLLRDANYPTLEATLLAINSCGEATVTELAILRTGGLPPSV